MKHVFFIHSNITYLAALGVICKENIDIDEVLILSCNCLIDAPIPVTKVDIKTKKEILFNPKKYFNIDKCIDNQIDNFIREDTFIAYVPSFHMITKFIVTHNKCVRFNFIEEGASSYVQKLGLNDITGYWCLSWRSSLKNRLRDAIFALKGFNSKLQALPYLYDQYYGLDSMVCYGFSELSFPNAKCKKVISFIDVKNRFKFDRALEIDNKLVFFGTSILNLSTLDDYMNAIDKHIIKYIKDNNIDHIFVKFHPIESKDSKRSTILLFEKNNIKYSIIDDSVMMELELMCSQNTKVFGVGTSLLLYAAQFGHNCYCISKYIKGMPKNDASWSGMLKDID